MNATKEEKAAAQEESLLRWFASVARAEVTENMIAGLTPWRVTCYDDKDQYIGGAMAPTYLEARRRAKRFMADAKRARKIIAEREHV